MEKYVAVDGATCKCKFSQNPQAEDKLVVKSQKKHYANDKNASKKLIASTKELGQTFEKGTFGNCLNQPLGNSQYKPCIPSVDEWINPYEKVTLSNQGKILIEDSKASCKFGAPGCIEITKHGQKAELGKQQMQKADQDILMQINPLLQIDVLDEEDFVCS